MDDSVKRCGNIYRLYHDVGDHFVPILEFSLQSYLAPTKGRADGDVGHSLAPIRQKFGRSYVARRVERSSMVAVLSSAPSTISDVNIYIG